MTNGLTAVLMSKSRLCLNIAIFLACLLGCASALAAVTADDLVAVVEKAKILSTDYQIRAALRAGEAEISTYRDPRANEKDCKIDAVLVAKEVMAVDPKGITRVRVRFYDTTNPNRYREVSVREGDVKAFAVHQLSPEQLLSSIEITAGDLSRERTYSRGTAEVVAGPFKGERLQMLGRIQSLKERGVGVGAFQALFNRLEDQAGSGDQDSVIDGLNFLNRKLNEAEQNYNQSHTARTSGGGASGVDEPRNRRGGQGAPPMRPASQADMATRLRQELGDDAPAQGPMLKRRYQVARKIRDLQDEGKIVDSYRRAYHDIEDAAARQDIPLLQLKLRVLEHQLGLPSLEIE